MDGQEARFLASNDKRVGQTAGQHRGGSRPGRLRHPVDLHAQFSIEHDECLLVVAVSVQRARVASLATVLKDGEGAPGGRAVRTYAH
jgi:hypothetical protein